MVYIYSDLHLGHANIIKYCNRPFNSVEEMDATILSGLDVLKPGDSLYFLGDLGLQPRNRIEYLQKVRDKGAMFFWILGNHDHRVTEEEKDLAFLVIPGYMDTHLYNNPVTLCHYPMLSWNRSHYGAYQFYGHHHTDVSHMTKGRQMNVCVDVTGQYAPLPMKPLLDKMENA